MKYNIAVQPYITGKPTHVAAPHALVYINYHLKKRRFIASYVYPIIQQYESTTV